MAWGLWAQASGMTSHLAGGERTRAGRLGIGALSSEQGLKLFDAACATGEALAIPVRLDTATLRAQARAGMVPALLRNLVRAPARRHSEAGGGSLARRLAGVSAERRRPLVLELVRGETAVVLGHASSQAIDEQRAFKELGFDSLAAVELRNRLNTATGLSLPASLVFDYPSPTAVADHLLAEIAGKGTDAAVLDEELDRLELALSSIALDDARRGTIARRMQLLLSRLEDTEIDDSADGEDIEAASDDEIFSLVDRELEAS